MEYTAEHLDATLASVMLHEQGALKFYGGEPTLNTENTLWAIAYLREHGFAGAIVIYSNGIKADQLLQLLASDPLGKNHRLTKLFHRDWRRCPANAHVFTAQARSI